MVILAGLLGPLGRSWAVLGQSWGDCAPVLGHLGVGLGAVLGSSVGLRAVLCGSLGAPLGGLGASWGGLRAVSGGSWAILGWSWAVLGRSGAIWGAVRGVFFECSEAFVQNIHRSAHGSKEMLGQHKGAKTSK